MVTTECDDRVESQQWEIIADNVRQQFFQIKHRETNLCLGLPMTGMMPRLNECQLLENLNGTRGHQWWKYVVYTPTNGVV